MTELQSLFLYLSVYTISAILIGAWRDKRRLLFGIVGMVLPILLAALRYPVGTDFWTYLQIWVGDTHKSYPEVMKFFGEPGFHLLSKLTHDFGDEQWYFGSLAALTLVPVIISYRRQFSNRGLGLFTFLFLLTMFTTSFNVIRQGVAVAFTFVASEYIFRRDLKRFCFWMIIATMFHLSAIIFAPAYLLNLSGKMNNVKRGFLLTILLVIIIAFTPIIESITEIETFDKYLGYINTDERAQNRSFIFSFVLLFIFLWRRKKMMQYDKHTNIYLVLTIIAILIEITGFYTPFLKRNAFYYNIYALILCYIWIRSFVSRRYFASLFIVGFFFIRFILTFYILQQSNIIPYSTKEMFMNKPHHEMPF